MNRRDLWLLRERRGERTPDVLLETNLLDVLGSTGQRLEETLSPEGDTVIGKWIDSLTDEQRDRIIEHPDPTYLGGAWWSFEHDCGCLVGCVVGQAGDWRVDEYMDWLIPELAIGDMRARHVGSTFPRFTRRFGAERMWRVVKARAAARNRVVLPEPVSVP
jgi:hypothetical protein